MTTSEKTWASAKDSYIRQVREALEAVKYPGANGIIEEVRQHLESRYFELPAESRNWEGYQQLITEMGPPSDYVDLLDISKLKRRLGKWKKIAIAVPLILIALVWAWDRGLIPLGSYNGPRTYVIPEMVGAPWGQPFTTDPELVGKWESVDFVRKVSEFAPGRPGALRDLYLKDVMFKSDGNIFATMEKRRPGLSLGKWTKSWILDRRSEIQAQYAFKEFNGRIYLFFPWLSGDVSRRYMPPCYYVMKKVDRIAPEDGTVNFDGKTGPFDIDNATLDDVIKAFGEPRKYIWDKAEFSKDSLPDRYIALYANGFSVCMVNGKVWELRYEGPDAYAFAGKLKFGTALDEALTVVGEPRETITGKAIGWADGTLYKDIDGRIGYCYYAVSDKHVRLFFQDYKVAAIFLTRSDQVEGRDAPLQVDKSGRLKEYADVRSRDVSKFELVSQPDILATLQFDDKTVWPKSLPVGPLPQEIMAAGKNPGLGVRELHKQGITGKGVSVAIIDQPLYLDHPEFAGKIAKYIDLDCGSETSMHGPAVASLLVGKETGTAPEATLYYIAAPSWLADSAYYAKALDTLVELNAQLPALRKIRAVSVSAAPSGMGSPFKKNSDMWDKARQRAEEAGMLVLDCTHDKGFIGPGYYDPSAPDEISKFRAGFPNLAMRANERIAVPCSRRTTAQEPAKGNFDYAYFGQGGLSWSIPYATGVLAMGWQIAPELSGLQMKELLFASAYGDAKIIDPPKFIEMVKAMTGKPHKNSN